MNQAHSFQTGSLKLLNIGLLSLLYFIQNIGGNKNASNAALLGLSSQLNQWNCERIANRNASSQPQEITIEDVNSLKKLIHVAINKTSIKYPEVIFDQLLFLTIGAIQIQSQTGSDKAWKLVNQSILSQINSQKENRLFSLGLTTTAIVICLSAMTMTNYKIHRTDSTMPSTPIESIADTTDPVTISTLLLAYNKMKSGTCQLPQAAMLPPEQRQAFLMFVNKGVIEVQHVENLRLALGYVNCLYPQELMHPVVTTMNKL